MKYEIENDQKSLAVQHLSISLFNFNGFDLEKKYHKMRIKEGAAALCRRDDAQNCIINQMPTLF